MSRELEQVLADHRGEAAVLRHQGHPNQAESIEKVCDDVAACMVAFLDWFSEEEAELHSGWGTARLRRWFPIWLEAGMAKLEGTGRRAKRLYRRCIVPHRAIARLHFEAGRRRAS